MIDALYQELRELARSRMRHERPDATLRATELVHEAFLRLEGRRPSPTLSPPMR
jgi:DNA-directed RNA polymerase specialized sigma24 family protein